MGRGQMYCHWLGLLALGCYAVHGGYHVVHGRPEDLLWVCHIGAVLVGFGLICSRASVNGIGTLLLSLGTPLWIMDLLAGSRFHPTSCLTHIVALAIGLIGVWRCGLPPGVWWKATLTMVALIGLSRLVTPEHANVNVAFAIQPGWEKYFPSHGVYLVVVVCQAAVYFFLMERVLRSMFVTRKK